MRWLIALLIALPWVIVPGTHDPFLLPKTLLWLLGTVLVIVSAQREPATAWRNRWTTWLVAVVIIEMAVRFWLTLMVWPSTDPQIPFLWFCVLPSFFVVLAILFVQTCATRLLRSAQAIIRITRVLCGVSVSVAVYALLQYFDLDQFLIGSHINGLLLDKTGLQHPDLFMIAALGNVQYTASYLALTLPLFCLFVERRYLVALAVVVLAIVLTHRRYAIALAAFSLASYGWTRWWWRSPRKALLWLALAVAVGGVICLSRWWLPLLLHDERWLIWGSVIGKWRTQSFTGLGIGAFPLTYFQDWETIHAQLPSLPVNSRWAWAHNDLLQWLMETGLFGLAALALCLGSTLRRAWRKTRTVIGAGYFACFLTLLASSLIYFPWHFAPTACVGLVIWSVCETTEGMT